MEGPIHPRKSYSHYKTDSQKTKTVPRAEFWIHLWAKTRSAGLETGKGEGQVSVDAQTCMPPWKERKENLSLKAAFSKLWGY